MKDLLAALDAARVEGEPALLALDADGTLWQGDITRDLVGYVMAERPLVADGLPRLREIAARHGVPLASDPYDQLSLLVLAYVAGTVPDAPAVESVVTAFAGTPATRFDELVHDAMTRFGLEARFHADMRAVFEWAERARVPVVVVSASPRLAVLHALAALDLRATAVLGAEPRVTGGRLAPELLEPVLVGEEKVHALRRHSNDPVLAAFGDDVRDVPLLSLAKVPVAVHPTAELAAHAHSLPGLHVLRARWEPDRSPMRAR